MKISEMQPVRSVEVSRREKPDEVRPGQILVDEDGDLYILTDCGKTIALRDTIGDRLNISCPEDITQCYISHPLRPAVELKLS